MTKYLSIALAASVVAATPAFAQTAGANANFVGPRAEVRGGWDRTTFEASYDDGETVLKDKAGETGLNIGAELGYDVPLGQAAIAGAYGGIEWATTKRCEEVYGDDKACLKLGRNFTLGARLGVAVTPSAMLYVKGGYSNGRIKASYHNTVDSDYDFSDATNRDGFHFGVGGEMAFGRNGYARVEYVRTNYNDFDSSDAFADVKIDAHRDQLLAGFGLRF